ncbi:hypothetical protein ABN034_13445 [Actinopolymorpha sp. B11F2]|uniref:hypothetical protein n=1 Tax=Actinopolymorpha sp. B11F2 TaxID=3160862 RepID=UPI0032E3CC3F
MLGTSVGGDLGSIDALKQWVHRTSATVDDATRTMRGVQEGAEESWTDDAGELFAAKLKLGVAYARRLADALDRLERLLDDCRDSVARAQELMADAERIADDGGLAIVDHRIVPPTYGDRPGGSSMPLYDQEQMSYLYDDPELREWYDARCRTYHEAEEQVERACQILVDRLDDLGVNTKRDWSSLYFTLGDIAGGEIGLLSDWRKGAYRKGMDGAAQRARDALERAGQLEDRAARRGNWSLVDAEWEVKYTNEQRADTLARYARRAGIVAKVLKGAGPVLTLISLAVDVGVKGDPVPKALASAGVGAIAGFAVVGIFGGPSGWLVLIAAGAVGYLAGDYAGELYDKYEPARDKLLREYDSLGPGPARLERPGQ